MSIIKNLLCSLAIGLTPGSTWATEAPQPDYFFSATTLTSVETRYGAQTSPQDKAWRQRLAQGWQFDSDRETLVFAEQFIDQVSFVSRITHCQHEVYSATPLKRLTCPEPNFGFNGDRHWLARVQGQGDHAHEQGGRSGRH